MTIRERRTFLIGICLSIPLSFSAPVRAQHQDYQAGPLPKEGSAFTGLAQAPEANLFVGAATTSIPIAVPPGRKNLTPKLALAYTSNGGPSAYGYGWDLPIGHIQRSTKHGVLTCGNLQYREDFVLVLPGVSMEFTRDATGKGVPKIEEAFLKIQHNAAQNYWEVWDKSGIRYRFGESQAARTGNDIIDLYHSQSCLQATDYQPLYTFSWGLTSIEDPNGNRLEVQYVPNINQTDGVMYPDRILYGGHTSGLSHQFEVDFVWAANRPAGDQIVNSMSGVPAKLTQYLSDVTVRHPVGGAVVRRYGLDYDFEVGPTRSGRQTFLSAVTLYDGSGQALARHDGLPASTTFLYQQNRPGDGRFGFGPAQHAPKPPAPLGLLRPMNHGRYADPANTNSDRDIFDINGDGFADWVVETLFCGIDAFWYVYPGGPGGFATTPLTWQLPSTTQCPIRTGHTSGGSPKHSFGDTDTLDLTGDGIPDYVVTSGWSTSTPRWTVYPGYVTATGGGFATTPLNWASPRKELRHGESDVYSWTGFDDAPGTLDLRDLIDLNGDGLLDLVEAPGIDQPVNYWTVWLNTGSGFDANGRRFYCPDVVLRASRKDDELQGLYDMNGDGLLDVVGISAAGNPWAVRLNTGDRMQGVPEWWTVPASLAGSRLRQMFGDYYADMRRAVLDINGDGLPDLVDRSGWTTTNPYWQVALNRGDGFSPTVLSWASPFSLIRNGDAGQTLKDTFDVDGDGLPDFVDFNSDTSAIKIYHNLGGAWCPTGNGTTCAATDGGAGVVLNPAGQRPDLLVHMENGIGGTTTLEYRPSTQWDNTGGDGIADLPFNTWTVTRIERDDGMCDASGANCVNAGGHTLVTNLTYQYGRFDAAGRVFRGFQKVDARDGDPGVVPFLGRLTFFHQGAALAGKIDDVQVYDASNGGTFASRPLSSTDTIWECASPTTGAVITCPSQPAGNVWVRQKRVDDYTYTTFQTGVFQKATTETHSWHQCGGKPYGNPAHVSNGDASGALRAHTHTEYACLNTGSAYIVDKPIHVWTNASNDSTTLEEKWFFYDYQGYGNVTKGNVSSVESWLDQWADTPVSCSVGTKWCARTRMDYDVFGNLTEVYDALDRWTRTTYDPTTKIYPSVVTNALGQKKATQYNPGCGVLLWESILYTGTTVPSEKSQRTYDSFCRLTATSLPDEDPVTSPHEMLFYALGSPRYPSLTLSREVNSPMGFRWAYNFSDGLGRAIQQQRNAVVDGAAKWAITTTEYDGRGHVARQYAPFAWAGASTYIPPPAGTGMTTFTTDALNRVSRVTNPDGTYRETDHSVAWQTTHKDECYTAANCAGGKTLEVRDALGRVAQKWLYEENTFKTRTVYTYDELGRLLTTRQGPTEITINGNTQISLSYDTLGRKVQMIDPDSGTWRYGYDAVGNLRYQDDPKANQHIQYCYDAGNRITLECPLSTGFNGTYPCTPTPPCTVERVTYAYGTSNTPPNYRLGRLISADDASGHTSFDEYDVRGRLRRVTQEIDPDGTGQDVTSATTAYDYDVADHLTDLTYPDGELVQYSYDAAGQVTKVRSNTHQEDYLSNLTYDLFGRQRLLTHGNGTIDSRTYGGAAGNYRLSEIATKKDSSVRLSYGYSSYTPTGLLKQLDDNGPTGPSNVMDNSATFTYDGLGRLTGASGPKLGTLAYQYDYLGNMTQKEGVALGYSSTKPHTLTTINGSGAGISHDLNGNRTAKPGQTYTYDHKDHLTQVSSGQVQFRYDYTGRRAVKNANGTITRYYGNLMDAADPSTTGWVTKYYYAGDMLIATRRQKSPGFAALPPDPAVRLADVHVGRPAIVLLLRRDVQAGVAVSLSLLAAGLLLAPPRRRRVVGIAVRHGHVIGVALTFTAGTLPWPLLLRPAPAAGQICVAPSTFVYHYHVDHLGSTAMISDKDGVAVEYVRYKPYGEVRGRYNSSGGAISPNEIHRYEFTGYETEFTLGLDYAGARFYDPALGMFLTHDPVPHHANPYSYVGWSPTNETDPDGQCELFCWVVIGIVLGALGSGIDAAVHGASVGQSIKAAVIGGVIGGVTAGVGAGIIAPVVQSLTPTLQYAVGLAAVGSGAYRTAESFQHGNYATGAFGAVLTAYGVAELVGAGAYGQASAGSARGGNLSQQQQLDFSSSQFDQRFTTPFQRGFWSGARYIGRTVGHDLEAAAVGIVAKPVVLAQDLWALGRSVWALDPGMSARNAFQTVYDAIIPTYGFYGGAGWGTRQFGQDGNPTPLNRVDWASFRHDITFRNLQWVRNVWSPNPAVLPPGPFGLAYGILGTPPFALTGALQ